MEDRQIEEGGTWTFLSVQGPLLCVTCALPFHEGERVGLLCTGQGLAKGPQIVGGWVVEPDESVRFTSFDLVHEECPSDG